MTTYNEAEKSVLEQKVAELEKKIEDLSAHHLEQVRHQSAQAIEAREQVRKLVAMFLPGTLERSQAEEIAKQS